MASGTTFFVCRYAILNALDILGKSESILHSQFLLNASSKAILDKQPRHRLEATVFLTASLLPTSFKVWPAPKTSSRIRSVASRVPEPRSRRTHSWPRNFSFETTWFASGWSGAQKIANRSSNHRWTTNSVWLMLPSTNPASSSPVSTPCRTLSVL